MGERHSITAGANDENSSN